MCRRDEILQYLDNTYHPLGVALYGSFADGRADEESDFDAVLIVNDKPLDYDGGDFRGTPLDVYLYTEEEAREPDDLFLFIQLYEAKILQDTRDGLLASLIESVHRYVEENRVVDDAIKRDNASWLKRMLARSRRTNAFGYYRHHWLLTASIEVYCRLRDQYYFGPGKTLCALSKENPADYALFEMALKSMAFEPLEMWIDRVCRPVWQSPNNDAAQNGR